MPHHSIKSTPDERRRGQEALSEFADYAEQQTHHSTIPAPNDSTAPEKGEDFDEINDLLSSLNVSEEPTVNLKNILLEKTESNLQTLANIIQLRIDEGHGDAIYDLGVDNAGNSLGFDIADWETALSNLREAAETISAHCRVLITHNVGGPEESPMESPTKNKVKGSSGTVLIRQIVKNMEEMAELRIAVVGNVDAGKSTMLGVLVKGKLDDGRGLARVNLFRHPHEVESGRTSSVGSEIMGLDSYGNIVGHHQGRKLSWEEICERSAKVITFYDLAGHERYLHTTVFGMMGHSPTYCILMVAANNGMIGMSREHLGIALSLSVPVMIIITKIDICPPNVLKETIDQLKKTLKSPGARKIPVFIKDKEETILTASQFVSQRICPIFQVSNVTGENLDLVRTFLNVLPHRGQFDQGGPFEFLVNDIFSVPHVGTVVAGVVKSGVIHTGDQVIVGPDSLGHFKPTLIKSIERKRTSVNLCVAGQSVSFALRRVQRKEVRKGMVVLNKVESPPKVYREFTAEVLILSHATTITEKYQAMVHVGAVSQTCRVIGIGGIDRPFLRTGDRALVVFQFIVRPEFITVGDKVLFREGKTKGLGTVTDIGFNPAIPRNVPDRP